MSEIQKTMENALRQLAEKRNEEVLRFLGSLVLETTPPDVSVETDIEGNYSVTFSERMRLRFRQLAEAEADGLFRGYRECEMAVAVTLGACGCPTASCEWCVARHRAITAIRALAGNAGK